MPKNETIALFTKTIAAGLRKRSLTTCSRWAQSIRVMGGKSFPGPWSFRNFPWLREMHDCNAEMWVGQKSAQMGYTETVLNRTFFKIDVDRTDCLYVLPAKTPDAGDFSAGRFDPALELSPYLATLFSDVKNIGHKRAGSTNLYIRGSRSKSGLKSVPVGLLVLDEVEEFTQENIPLAFERQSGQLEKQTIAISTPRVSGLGINLLFEQTTKEHFFFKCPHCNKYIELLFPDSIIITAESFDDPKISETHLICSQCKGKLEHQDKYQWLESGKWEASITNRDARGFYINQLYSSTVTPKAIAESYFKAQLNPADEQEFYNSKLGLTHTVAGARLTLEDINNCVKDYKKNCQVGTGGIITLGIDQGRWIHYEIDYWPIPSIVSGDPNSSYRPKVIDSGKLLHFEELDNLMRLWHINAAVIDAQPERRKAGEFAARFPGFVYLCFYGKSGQGKILHFGKDINEPTVTAERTYWLDTALGRFRSKRISLPVDIGMEYKNHMTAPMRVYEKDENGNAVGRYVKAESDQDHLAHCRTYAEIALQIAIDHSTSIAIKSPR
jgi:hypothetical protein